MPTANRSGGEGRKTGGHRGETAATVAQGQIPCRRTKGARCTSDGVDLPSRDAGHGIHHPFHGQKLKEESDRVGHECHLVIPGCSKSDRYADGDAFLVAKLLAKD